MKKVSKKPGAKAREMLSEYDFRTGVRGKYARRYAGGTNVVRLDPDVAKVFSTTEAVNKALRSLVSYQEKTKSA